MILFGAHREGHVRFHFLRDFPQFNCGLWLGCVSHQEEQGLLSHKDMTDPSTTGIYPHTYIISSGWTVSNFTRCRLYTYILSIFVSFSLEKTVGRPVIRHIWGMACSTSCPMGRRGRPRICRCTPTAWVMAMIRWPRPLTRWVFNGGWWDLVVFIMDIRYNSPTWYDTNG